MTESQSLSLAAVFLISRKCNLQCTYCNIGASPRLTWSLAPQQFESWIRAFGKLGGVRLGVQLHGGEPLLLSPPVELLASIARNALAPEPSSAIGRISIVTNGTLLSPDRARSLVGAGLHVTVSVDGPQHVHDRRRVTGTGQGSHRRAMRGLDALRSVGAEPGVIGVISDPSELEAAVRFFMSEGLSRVKINPIRPEGRGTTLRKTDDAADMLALADAYVDVAKMLAAYNRRAKQPIYEENIGILLARAIGGGTPGNGTAVWTLLVDEHGDLWAHPGGYGVEHMALATGTHPSAELVARALGIDGDNRAKDVTAQQRQTFRPCGGCTDPMWCTRFRPLVGGPAFSADCAWRDRLTSRLQEWWQESPAEAIHVLPSSSSKSPMHLPAPDSTSPSSSGGDRVEVGVHAPLEPVVQSVLNGIRTASNGQAYVSDLADRVTEICCLDPRKDTRTFLQLAALARGYAGRTESRAVAYCLARLARVGLEPLGRGSRSSLD